MSHAEMENVGADLVLGSASARRRDLLATAGISFRVLTADVDERALPGERPSAYLERIVTSKLAAVAARLDPSAPLDVRILCADTIVVVGDEILGKPTDDEHAVRMLGLLVGGVHAVMTRYAIGSASGDVRVARQVTTEVAMRTADERLIRDYVATGEGRDKAGSYAIQGIGGFLVERIEGSYSNVVGLPLAEVVRDLETQGVVQQLSGACAPEP